MDNFDLYGEIKMIIAEQTYWLRHFSGKVLQNNDPIMKGRVFVSLIEDGSESEEGAFWAFPREKNIQIPNIGDIVEVYFMDGDESRPFYVGIISVYKDQLAKNYSMPSKNIIFEDRMNDSNNIIFDRDTNKYTINNGTESYVKGDTLKTELQKVVDQLTQLKTDLTNWTPVPNDGGGALKALVTSGFLTKTSASLTNILSEIIKAK